ncbi:MAG: hypothetical protein WBQ18_20595 [Solirubrobacteraceae bacterium]
MKRSSILAVGGATVALVLSPAAALAAGTSVSVRVEGATRTLLRATTVHTHGGAITKGGTPAGACPATTAAGALDVATHHNWTGSYGSIGLSVNSIFGERHTFSSGKYWSIFVDNRYAQAGVCGLKLHRGEKLLFAAVPAKGTEYPIVLSAPAHAGRTFTVRASSYGDTGRSKPLSGVLVKGAGTTNAKGTVTVTVPRSGKVTLTASRKGYVRAEATVSVS